MSKSVAIGAGRTLVSEAIGRGAAIGFQMLVANQLGASNFGVMAVALAAAATLSPLADAGLPNLALQLVSTSPDDNRLVARFLSLKIASTPLFLLPLFVWAALSPENTAYGWPLVWAGLFYGFQASSDLLRQILRARDAAKQELSARAIFPVANLVALFLVWRFKPGPAGALLALASGPFVLTIAYLWKFPEQVFRIDLRDALRNFAAKHWVSIAQSLAYLFMVGTATRIDAFILQAYSTTYHVGRFFAASNLVLAGLFFGQGLSSFLYPRLHRQTVDKGRALLRASGLQAAVGIGLSGGAALIGPFVFRMVFRAESYAGAENMLPGFALILLVATMDWLWLSILIGKGRLWIAALNLVPALLLKLILGRLWVPTNNELGMLWASVAAYGFSGSLNAIFAIRLYLRSQTSKADI